MRVWICSAILLPFISPSLCSGQVLAQALSDLSPTVLDESQRETAASLIERDLQRRQAAANARNRDEWDAIHSKAEWESYRDTRLARMKRSLGSWPDPPEPLDVRLTGTVEGDGFVIEKVVYQSRPDDWVTGLLYRPSVLRKSMPGILISHAHHHGKNHGELQDMGMTWARAGCLVLVIDQVGYGERRAHPFHDRDDYEGDYRVGRQDYYHRYDSGLQLHLVGESLMGWMVWDHMRGVDLLLAREGIDPDRIIMLGAVAGGGDPCGITAALDDRIAAAVPFNFGGPQPETRYPLPEDAEISFNYLMGSYWDSTRGLRRTAADGYFHWLITAAIAPRRLIHAHEFAWDRERDPVWQRYQRIYRDFYEAEDRLAFAHGKGLLRGDAAEASHCGQIGRFHRRMIHPVFQRWFGIEVDPDDEFRDRRDPEELLCLTVDTRRRLQAKRFCEVASKTGRQRVQAMRMRLESFSPDERRRELRESWAELLGQIELTAAPRLAASRKEDTSLPDATVQRVVLEVERDVILPMIVLTPKASAPDAPIVIGLAQSGKESFLRHRAGDVAALLDGGATVCLPDLRGTGEIAAGSARGRTSGDTNRSVNMLLHDQTPLGQRLRDLKSIMAWVRSVRNAKQTPFALWGDSFAPTNSDTTNFKVPRGVARPAQSEPLGGLLALLGALFDDDVNGVYVHGGLSSFHSALQHYQIYLPHDTVIPGTLTAGDLSDLTGALAPRPVTLHALVDALNRPVPAGTLKEVYKPAIEGYRDAGAEENLHLGERSPAEALLGK